jgi:hypothetical protein
VLVLAGKAYEQRSSDRSSAGYLNHRAQPDPESGEIAQGLGLGVGDTLDHQTPAHRAVPQLRSNGIGDGEVLAGNRIPVRIQGWMSEVDGYAFLELFREDVLEDLRLIVDLVPGHPERLGEIGLEQTVMADDLESNCPAPLREPGPVIGHVRLFSMLVADAAETSSRCASAVVETSTEAGGCAGRSASW